jgi:hypothetical protein
MTATLWQLRPGRSDSACLRTPPRPATRVGPHRALTASQPGGRVAGRQATDDALGLPHLLSREPLGRQGAGAATTISPTKRRSTLSAPTRMTVTLSRLRGGCGTAGTASPVPPPAPTRRSSRSLTDFSVRRAPSGSRGHRGRVGTAASALPRVTRPPRARVRPPQSAPPSGDRRPRPCPAAVWWACGARRGPQRSRKTSRWVLMPGALTAMTYVPGAAWVSLLQRRRSQSTVAR